jgi:hypothetical protein
MCVNTYTEDIGELLENVPFFLGQRKVLEITSRTCKKGVDSLE